MFELIPSDNFGINYDPSHFIWQQIDYIKPIYEFKDKIVFEGTFPIDTCYDVLDQLAESEYDIKDFTTRR